MDKSFSSFGRIVFAVLVALKVADLTTLSWLYLILLSVVVSVVCSIFDAIDESVGQSFARWRQRRRLRRHF